MSEVPDLDLSPEIELLREDFQRAFERVIDSRRFILGQEVREFERELAEYLGTEYVVGVNSGTDALVLALDALDIRPGDEVITTPFSFFATAESICRVGATPVFADIDPHTLNIDPDSIEEALTERTKAILPVHLFGLPAPMERINEIAERRNLPVLEDAAQACGAAIGSRRVGSWGDLGAFSFFPSKTLGGFGDGGAISTNDRELAQRIESLRNHGKAIGNVGESRSQGADGYTALGYNSRLDELQAALLRVKLPRLDKWIARRQEIGRRYRVDLRDLNWIEFPQDSADAPSACGQVTLRVVGRDREQVREQLQRQGISTRVYYPQALSDLEVLRKWRPSTAHVTKTPHAVLASRQVLSLPLGPLMSEASRRQVVAALRAC